MKIARFYITNGTDSWHIDAPWSCRTDIDANAAMEGHTIYHVSFPTVLTPLTKPKVNRLPPAATTYLRQVRSRMVSTHKV